MFKQFNLNNLENRSYFFWLDKIKKWQRSGPSYNYQEYDYIKEKFKYNQKKIIQIDHHLAHAATAFYPSGFKNSSILIADGLGRWGNPIVFLW